MSDEERQGDLWRAMDRDFSAAVQSSEDIAQHAQVGRDDLERHVREDHGVVAETKVTLDPATERADGRMRIVEKVIELGELGETWLRVSHWRMHESGFVPHRPREGEK